MRFASAISPGHCGGCISSATAARPALTFQRLSAAEALVEWVKHSFLLDVEERPRLASHFDQVAALANRPIHYRLDYPRRFEELAEVRHAISAHVQQEGNEG